MVRKIILFFTKIFNKRSIVLSLFFCVLSGVLINRLYDLQIIKGESYANSFNIITTKERSIKATRGNIFDRRGNLLAYNELVYAVTLEDNGTYPSNRIKQLSINSEIYKLINIIEGQGDSLYSTFHIFIDEHGSYQFDVSGVSLQRFRADVFGKAKITDMTDEEAIASADEIMSLLAGSKYFMILPDGTKDSNKPYSVEELAAWGLPGEYSGELLLKMVSIRYQLYTTSYKRYVPVTIATDISDTTMAIIMENQASLQGVDVVQDYKRVYNDAVYFASLIGYTGKASSEELEELEQKSDKYSNSSIIGKAGIEQYMETELQGTNGSETVYVNNLGTVQEIDEESRIEPKQGNDVYLTIDSELQVATYKLLEQRIAGILLANMRDVKENTSDSDDTATIPVAVYDAYFSIINNNIVDYRKFAREDASENERAVNEVFKKRLNRILNKLKGQLTGEDRTPYKDLTDAQKAYQSYIVNDMLMDDTGILMADAIPSGDETYTAWSKDETISLYEFLKAAVSQNWIDVSKIAGDTSYLSTDEILVMLYDYICTYLAEDSGYAKLIYKYGILNDEISPRTLCLTLYDQGVLKQDDETYNKLKNGDISPFEFMYMKIESLEITPAQLALDPCSGSVVITDPNSGEFLAVVSYPGYDNNRLANTMDSVYYNELLVDLSEPFYNKATQQKTAPGSTFKPITAIAGMSEGLINTTSVINCSGVFDEIEGSPLRCWKKYGHGDLTVVDAIKESCNVFFSRIAWTAGLNDNEKFIENRAITTLEKYCSIFGLDKKSGIEINETSPQVSNAMPVPSGIGQGTHNYTTTQLARYVSTLANSGISYKMTMLDKVTDSQGNTIDDYSAEVDSVLEVTPDMWNVVHNGMRQVITNKPAFDDLGVAVAGKTGTAQESKSRSSHGLFIGYAPYDKPEMALCVRIAHGYSSTNAAMVAKDVFNYYFNLKEEDQLITGRAVNSGVSNVQQD